MEGKQTNLFIPAAILIAGAMIASAVMYSNKGPVDTTPKFSLNTTDISDADHILGDRNASIKIVEYSATECPFCKVYHSYLHELVQGENKIEDLAWVYRHFPIESLHKKAIREAEATECVAKIGGEDTFWTYLDSIYANTNSNDSLPDEMLFTLAEQVGVSVDEFSQCLESGEMNEKILASIDEAQDAGARGTPYSILYLDEKLSDEQIETIKAFDLEVTQGHPTNRVFRVDEVSKDKVSLSGAIPGPLVAELINIIRE